MGGRGGGRERLMMWAELVDSRGLSWVWERCSLVCEIYGTFGLSGDCDCTYQWDEYEETDKYHKHHKYNEFDKYDKADKYYECEEPRIYWIGQWRQ
jgi:hypothetical protein